jgi:hypothetical protein
LANTKSPEPRGRTKAPVTARRRTVIWRRSAPGAFTWWICGVEPKRVAINIEPSGIQSAKLAGARIGVAVQPLAEAGRDGGDAVVDQRALLAHAGRRRWCLGGCCSRDRDCR